MPKYLNFDVVEISESQTGRQTISIVVNLSLFVSISQKTRKREAPSPNSEVKMLWACELNALF